jgi:FkbH-like protein
MLLDLDWLLPEPPDLRARLKSATAALAANDAASAAAILQGLAQHRLDLSQLGHVAKRVRALLAADAAAGGLVPLRLGLIGWSTLAFMADALVGTGPRFGLAIDLVEGDFGAPLQQALNPQSRINAARPDMLLLATDARGLGLATPALTPVEAQSRVADALAQVQAIVTAVRPNVASAILIETLVAPLEPLFGNWDAASGLAPLALVEAFNRALIAWANGDEAKAAGVVIIDTARAAAAIGLSRWHDPRHWHNAKLAVAPDAVPAHADLVVRTLAAIRGRAKKCLVLDLDNTLWGGVIGDDGVDGIVLGQGDARGEAHLAVQQMALDLRARGVILAVCSKNEDETARLPFRRHPEMLLKEEHIAVFQANWQDKASNLRAIASALNIGIDALVFLDDNPAERAQVRAELPMVAVPEVGSDPALYPRLVLSAGWFELLSLSEEDRLRADLYQKNAERAALAATASDMDGFLRSLEMTCAIGRVDPVSRPRVAQLINKSNQFNLTTRRYSEAEVAALEADPAVHAIQVRLTDRFGDNGIIAVLIARRGAVAADGRRAWDIDSWLMSCRVLERRVEQACLAHLAAAARADGAELLIGTYVPTAKNMMVADHYRKLGFVAAGNTGGTTRWQLDLGGWSAPELPMTIVDTALPQLA